MRLRTIFELPFARHAAVTAGILLLSLTTVTAQLTLNPLFNAGVMDGNSNGLVSAVQPDGKILVGGIFSIILRSEDFSFHADPFGTATDVPAPGDYDGDGKSDLSVFRPSEATWYIQRTTAGILIRQFGASEDRAVPNSYVR